jgi:hypothetical protein
MNAKKKSEYPEIKISSIPQNLQKIKRLLRRLISNYLRGSAWGLKSHIALHIFYCSNNLDILSWQIQIPAIFLYDFK